MGRPAAWLTHLPVAAAVLVDQVVEGMRAIGAERLLWTGLWVYAPQGRTPVPCQDFLIMNLMFAKGIPVAKVPLMQAIAERSVRSAARRAPPR